MINSKHPKKVLILGGTGLIGTDLNLFLDALNHLCLSIDKSNLDFTQSNSCFKLKEILNSFSPDVVIVLSAIKRQLGDSRDIMNLNDQIISNIISVLSGYSCFTIYLSSCSVFGEKNNQHLISEKSAFSPTSFYGEHKVRSEQLFTNSFDASNLLILRPPLVYSYRSHCYSPSGLLFQATNSGIVYFFCVKLEVLKRLFLLSDMPQPLDITLKAFQTK